MQLRKPTRRFRFFRFRLRTFLIFTALLGGVLGWQLRLSRERRAVLDWLDERGPVFKVYGDPSGPTIAVGSADAWTVHKVAPSVWWRRLLGETPAPLEIDYPESATPDEIERVRAAFPNAQLNWQGQVLRFGGM